MDPTEQAAQKLSLSKRRRSQQPGGPQGPPGPQSPGEGEGAQGPLLYTGGFSGALQLSPPAVPPCLLRAGAKVKDTPGMGKVKVMLRVCAVQSDTSESFLKVDARRKQLTLCEVTSSSGAQRRPPAASAPKIFAFDAIFTQDASQAEVCSGTVAEVVQSVINGADGCIFCYGHANLGKSYTMLGRECSTQSLGVTPTAVSWLYRVMEERRERCGASYSVGVSAVEISGREEMLTDLLAHLGGGASSNTPSVLLREDPVSGSQLQNQCVLRAPTAERAAFLLDAALAVRSSAPPCEEESIRRNSHLLFTLHLQQQHTHSSKTAMSGGSCRLHLLDLGSCETDISGSRETGGVRSSLSLSALGNVLLALANGAKHVPYRDSKLTMLLREALGNINCRTIMVAHVSDSPVNYMETLTTVQLASRIQRMRKTKTKSASSSSGGDSSCEEGGRPAGGSRPSSSSSHLRPLYPRTVALDPDVPPPRSAEQGYSSSSEQSCDTVIYVGPGGAAVSDRDLSDNEGPPASVPIIPSLNKRLRINRPRPRSDGDHLKCDTFRELQERLTCIDGSEGPAGTATEGPTVTAEEAAAQSVQTESTDLASSLPKADKPPSQSPSTTTSAKPDRERSKSPSSSSAGGIVPTDTASKRTLGDGEKVVSPRGSRPGPGPAAKPSRRSSAQIVKSEEEPAAVVREKTYLGKGTLSAPKPFDSPSIPRASLPAAAARAPPVGDNSERGGALGQGRDATEGVVVVGEERSSHVHRDPVEVGAAWLRRRLERDILRTTVTLQQPVELNGEDELVFTVVEELPLGLLPDNGRPCNLLSFSSERSLQQVLSGGSPRGSRPVSIISSINDEYDMYTSSERRGGDDAAAAVAVGSDVTAPSQDERFPRRCVNPLLIGSWASEASVRSLDDEGERGHSSGRFSSKRKSGVGVTPDGAASAQSSPAAFHREIFLTLGGAKSSLTDSGVGFSELDSDPATPSKPPLAAARRPPSPDSARASPRGYRARANTLSAQASSQVPHYPAHASLPRKVKPTSTSAAVSGYSSKQEGRRDDPWFQGSVHFDFKDAEFPSAGKPLRSGTLPSRRPGGNSNSVPRPPKTQASLCQRVVDGCEKPVRRGDTLVKMPQLTRGATTLGTVSVPHSSSESKWSHDGGSSGAGSLRFASLGKKGNGQRTGGIPKSGSGSISPPPAPPVRKSSLDHRTRIALSPSASRTGSEAGRLPKTSTSEEEFTARFRADSFSYKTSSLKADHGSARVSSSSLKTRGAKGDCSRFYGSVASLERYSGQASAGSRPSLSRENSGASLGGNGKTRSVPRLGVPASTSVLPPSSPSSSSSAAVFVTTSKLTQLKGQSASSRSLVASSGSRSRTLSSSSSKTLAVSFKLPEDATPATPAAAAARNTSLPPSGKSPARSVAAATKPGRGTIMGTKQAISRAANSRVSELASTSQRKQFAHASGIGGSDDVGAGGTSGAAGAIAGGPPTYSPPPLPSPYSKITAPRRPQRYSSGHGSDNSSVLSGELPPAMGRTALFYHSGGSSGYESMIRDSETTGTSSSAHDSMSESGVSSSNRSRVSRTPKKRGNGFQRRRLIPAPMPDTSSLGRKPGGGGAQWVDLPPLGGGALKEPFEIKVYEIDDVERLQRKRDVMAASEQPFQDVEKGLLYFNARLRMLEKRQQQIRELRLKHDRLRVELDKAKSRLMLDQSKWSGEFDMDPDMDPESQDYLEVLAQTTAELEFCVNLCKSRVMMETCFDIAPPTPTPSPPGTQEVEV